MAKNKKTAQIESQVVVHDEAPKSVLTQEATSSNELTGHFRFGEVAWLHISNTARRFKPKVDPTRGAAKVLTASMLLGGWRQNDINAFIVAEKIGNDNEAIHDGATYDYKVETISKDADGNEIRQSTTKYITFKTWGQFKQFVLNERKLELERLEAIYAKNTADPDATAKLTVFKKLYCEDDGSLIVPKVWAVTGHQRSICLPYAFELRLNGKGESILSKSERDAIGDSPLPSNWTAKEAMVPALIVHFDNEGERTRMQVRENEGKVDGATLPDPLDRLASTRVMLASGMRQADVRECYTASEGVKLCHLIIHDNRFPKLRLWERLHMDPTKEPTEALEYRKIDGPTLPKITRRSDREALDSYNQREKNKAATKKNANFVAEEFMSEKDVDQWYREEMAGGSSSDKQTKIMDKNKVKELATGQKDYAAKAALNAVLKNDGAELGRLTTTVEGRNAVMELSDALPDVYGEVEQMLLKFRACPYENVVREAVKTAMATFKAGIEKMKAEAPAAPAPAPETVSA